MRLDEPESSIPVALDGDLRAKAEMPIMARSAVDGVGRRIRWFS